MLILQHEDEEIAGDALYKSQRHWIKQQQRKTTNVCSDVVMLN